MSGFNIIESLDSILDLVLVSLNINEEGQGVVFLNLLHGSLGVERLTNDTVLIHTGSMGNRLTSILGSTVQNQSLGDVEVSGSTNLTDSLTMDTLEGGLLGSESLVLRSYLIEFEINIKLLLFFFKHLNKYKKIINVFPPLFFLKNHPSINYFKK